MMFIKRGEFTMTDWMLLILAISCWPFMAIFGFGASIEIYYLYCPIQIIALLIIYFLRKKGILKSSSPLTYYVLGFIIGHVIFVAISYWALMEILPSMFFVVIF